MQSNYKMHKESLRTALVKPNTVHDIVYLLKETFVNRQSEMKKWEGQPMYKLCKEFPVFTKSKYVCIITYNITCMITQYMYDL